MQVISQPQNLRLDVAVGANAGAVHHALVDVNWRAQAHSQGDGIAGSGVNLDCIASRVNINHGEENIFAQIIDVDVAHRSAHFLDGGLEQVVGQRPFARHALQLKRYRFRLELTNPDGQVTLFIDIAQHDQAMLRHQAYLYSIHDHFNHRPVALFEISPMHIIHRSHATSNFGRPSAAVFALASSR